MVKRSISVQCIDDVPEFVVTDEYIFEDVGPSTAAGVETRDKWLRSGGFADVLFSRDLTGIWEFYQSIGYKNEEKK